MPLYSWPPVGWGCSRV